MGLQGANQLAEPVLVAATFPVPEIGFGDTMGIWAEFLKDVGVGKANRRACC